MLSFELDDEQKMLVEAINKFAESQMRKLYRDAEEDNLMPNNLRQSGWEFGLIPSGIPEQYGGFGEYSIVTGALAMEAFAYGDLAITLGIESPGLVAIPIMLAGTEAQKAKYLPLFCEEKSPAVTAAIIEPSIQYDPRELHASAVRENGTYVLDGVKCCVPFAAEAETVLVYANLAGQTEAFLVPVTTEGFQIVSRDKLMGIKALPCYTLKLDNCQLPQESKLGGEDGIDFNLILNHSRVALGAAAVGLAKAGSDYARSYAKERVQFEEPIAHRQSIAFLLAEMAIAVDGARLMVWETAWKLDQGKEATEDAAIMKHFIDQMVVNVTDSAVQILGGYGYVREYPVELWLRNARGFSSFDGLAIV